ncbi:MAG TPA: hypothetical protein VHA37_04325 [Candidatus Saccharimonadales bacterium]|nr:hypothetical protein [Candidatus Saccharimonadales bacterium]
MKYFLDTEFIEDGKTIDLISVGIAAEDGRTLYLQNADCIFFKETHEALLSRLALEAAGSPG